MVGFRDELIENVNRAFSAENIRGTLGRLAPLAPREDVFDILDRLGFLDRVQPHDIRRYRREVGIPPLNQRILTIAFRASLLARPLPVPLHLNITGGEEEAIEIATATELIEVRLTRVDRPRNRS
jgi:hypothetical protein